MITAPISVVIPAYNGEAFIAEAIKSVQAQTLPVAEIIVVDDGSSDGTVKIAESLVARVLRQPNGGVAAARNAGILSATQPWIAFLDHDDLWEPEKISRQWEAYQTCTAVGVVSCDFCLFEGERLIEPSFLRRSDINYEQARKTNLKPGVSLFPNLGPDFFSLGFILFPSAVMVCRDLLLSVGLFNSKFDGNDECDCFLRALAHSSLAIVEQPLMRYRLHDNNASKDSLKMHLGHVALIDQMATHPELYPKEAPKAWGTGLCEKLNDAGRLLLGEGKLKEARPLLRRSLKEEFSFRALLLFCMAWCRPAIFKSLLAVKHAFARKHFRGADSGSQVRG